VNALAKEVQVVLKNIIRLDAFCQQRIVKHNSDERGIPCQVCNNYANHLLIGNVNLF
jgi:hypothetical protein